MPLKLSPAKQAYYDLKQCINGPHPNERWPKALCGTCQNQLSRKQRAGRQRKHALQAKAFLKEYLGVADTPFLVRLVDVEQEGGLFKLSLQDEDKNRVTALLSGANVWALVQGLTALIERDNATRHQQDEEGRRFARAYHRG